MRHLNGLKSLTRDGHTMTALDRLSMTLNPGAPTCTKNCANLIPARFFLFDLDDNNLRKPFKSLIFSPLSDESVEMFEK